MEAAEEWMAEHHKEPAETEDASEKFKALTPTERGVISRGHIPKSIEGDAEKERLAQEYAEYKKQEKKAHHKK